MRPISFLMNAVVALLAVALLAGCGTTATPSDNPGASAGPPFGSFLVIGISGDYNSRAQFERQLVGELRRQGAAARAYHAVIGSNQPITPDSVRSALEADAFDAILVTRVLDSDIDVRVKKNRDQTDATPIGGRILNLFRYNYTDYSNPGRIDLKTSVSFAIELYDAAAEEIVWSMESSSRGEKNIGLLIDRTAETIAKRINREKLIAR